MVDEIVSVKRMQGVAYVRLLSGEEMKFPSVLLKEKPLRQGRMVDTEAYMKFVGEKALPYALERAVKMQAMREHTEKEVEDKLKRSAYPDFIIAKVMALLTTSELVSDERFAESWLRHREKSYGKQRIAMEMRQKGLNQQHIEKAMENWEEESEENAALKWAEKFFRQGKDAPHVMNALLRRGYGYSLARRAVLKAEKKRRPVK